MCVLPYHLCRFSDFEVLRANLVRAVPKAVAVPRLPPKTFKRNFTLEHRLERSKSLEEFLGALLTRTWRRTLRCVPRLWRTRTCLRAACGSPLFSHLSRRIPAVHYRLTTPGECLLMDFLDVAEHVYVKTKRPWVLPGSPSDHSPPRSPSVCSPMIQLTRVQSPGSSILLDSEQRKGSGAGSKSIPSHGSSTTASGTPSERGTHSRSVKSSSTDHGELSPSRRKALAFGEVDLWRDEVLHDSRRRALAQDFDAAADAAVAAAVATMSTPKAAARQHAFPGSAGASLCYSPTTPGYAARRTPMACVVSPSSPAAAAAAAAVDGVDVTLSEIKRALAAFMETERKRDLPRACTDSMAHAGSLYVAPSSPSDSVSSSLKGSPSRTPSRRSTGGSGSTSSPFVAPAGLGVISPFLAEGHTMAHVDHLGTPFTGASSPTKQHASAPSSPVALALPSANCWDDAPAVPAAVHPASGSLHGDAWSKDVGMHRAAAAAPAAPLDFSNAATASPKGGEGDASITAGTSTCTSTSMGSFDNISFDVVRFAQQAMRRAATLAPALPPPSSPAPPTSASKKQPYVPSLLSRGAARPSRIASSLNGMEWELRALVNRVKGYVVSLSGACLELLSQISTQCRHDPLQFLEVRPPCLRTLPRGCARGV